MCPSLQRFSTSYLNKSYVNFLKQFEKEQPVGGILEEYTVKRKKNPGLLICCIMHFVLKLLEIHWVCFTLKLRSLSPSKAAVVVII